ncbi:MAG: choice-of-anchor J domain-containing protein [Bacteroidales bacterium]|nr:choice-of-anchor J domain-containing protein [Bacteroidales bacterium]
MKKLSLLTIIFAMLCAGLNTTAQNNLKSAEYILSWDVCPTANTPSFRAEYYSVWISTSGNTPDDFTTMLFEETLSTTHTNWVYENRQVNIDNYANVSVFVAFRHHDITDMDRIVIDNVKLFRVNSDGEEELVYLFENFQDGIGNPAGEDWLPEGWVAIDDDGDQFNWYFGERQGEGAMRSQSWDSNPLTPDNWLITPAILLGSVGINELPDKRVSIFPNPASSSVNVNSNSEIKQIELVNMVGTRVLSQEMNDLNTGIDVSSFKNGLYFMRLYTIDGIVVKKLHIIK